MKKMEWKVFECQPEKKRLACNIQTCRVWMIEIRTRFALLWWYILCTVYICVIHTVYICGLVGYRVNPVDLSPQYASVLTGVARSGQLGATVSTGLAGALRQKVSHLHTLKIQAHDVIKSA